MDKLYNQNSAGRLHLLIADDEKTIREGIKRLVEGYDLGIDEISTAQNGVEALDIIKSLTPELMIVDINMPLMDGLDFIERAVNIQPESKIIILTGYDQFDYAQRALSLGVYAYLLKPVNRNELRKTLVKARDSYMNRMCELARLEGLRDQPIAVNQPLGYVKEHYAEPTLSLGVVATKCNLSPSQVSRVIKVETGLAFSDYLTMLRIEQAKRLLLSPKGYMIYEIADMVGYSTQHYFCHAFKQYTQITPTEYRKRG